ncbi:MAG: NAD(P)H-dependent glycerol-3-phosphate dehydrogenase [Cyanobacteria bacterium MAG CAR3_bin_5]|nr:NAD(P)H-dependent glycerol-3-phosphate dehydrogenase [Cyanobacteria bacterium MAG CAR3_bin_5]
MAHTIALLGLGLWGQCLAQLFRGSGHRVQGWSRRLGGDPGDCLSGADLLVSAVSMAALPSLAPQLGRVIPPGLPLVSCSKGIAVDTLLTPLGVWDRFCPQVRGLVLSGPNLSAELRQGLPAATVLSSRHTALAMELQQVLSGQQLRIYCNDDPRGTELAGALKNTMVIAAGVSDGLGLGSNAKASLLCRGLSEMGVVLDAMGGRSQTLYGLAGLGDLLATANSPLSRNYRFGLELGRGKTPAAAEACCEGAVEGIPTTHAVVALAERHGFAVPIARQVLKLLKQRATPAESVASLMERNLRPEAQGAIEVGFSRQ